MRTRLLRSKNNYKLSLLLEALFIVKGSLTWKNIDKTGVKRGPNNLLYLQYYLEKKKYTCMLPVVCQHLKNERTGRGNPFSLYLFFLSFIIFQLVVSGREMCILITDIPSWIRSLLRAEKEKWRKEKNENHLLYFVLEIGWKAKINLLGKAIN